MSYVSCIKESLREKIVVEEDLLNLYSLLVLVKGEHCTVEDVHDAWSIWTSCHRPEHKSLVPHEDLGPEVQELDVPYCLAIIKVAQELKLDQE